MYRGILSVCLRGSEEKEVKGGGDESRNSKEYQRAGGKPLDLILERWSHLAFRYSTTSKALKASSGTFPAHKLMHVLEGLTSGEEGGGIDWSRIHNIPQWSGGWNKSRREHPQGKLSNWYPPYFILPYSHILQALKAPILKGEGLHKAKCSSLDSSCCLFERVLDLLTVL